MYLSKLCLRPGFPGRQLAYDLSSFYEMHRTIWRSFPQDCKRILFRLEPDHILVQSEDRPDWGFLKKIPGYLTSATIKEFSPQFSEGQALVFRLRANPTKNVVVGEKQQRLGIMDNEECVEWLKYKGEVGGFSLLSLEITIQPTVWKIYKPKRITIIVAQFDGLLQVTDPVLFAQTVQKGLGKAKSFGVGLLSVAQHLVAH
jgi:CRISPR system Cascade subunit CasE